MSFAASDDGLALGREEQHVGKVDDVHAQDAVAVLDAGELLACPGRDAVELREVELEADALGRNGQGQGASAGERELRLLVRALPSAAAAPPDRTVVRFMAMIGRSPSPNLNRCCTGSPNPEPVGRSKALIT